MRLTWHVRRVLQEGITKTLPSNCAVDKTGRLVHVLQIGHEEVKRELGCVTQHEFT